MDIKKFLPIAIFIGVQACIIQIIDQCLCLYVEPVGNKGFGWISFQAWAVYFLAGCTVKGGIKSFIGYFIGMIASIVIMKGAGILSFLGFLSVPLVLLILVPAIIYLELAPDLLNLVPAVFVGAGVYFGFKSYVDGATFTNVLVTESIYCVLGLVFGWATVTFRGWYENHYLKAKAQA
jgi:hypothetical protein